jgi:hypothetical protein
MRCEAKVRMRVYGGDHQAQKYACQDMGRIFPPTVSCPLACCKTGCNNSRKHVNGAMHHSKFRRKHSNSELDLSSFMYNFLSKLLSRGFFYIEKDFKK